SLPPSAVAKYCAQAAMQCDDDSLHIDGRAGNGVVRSGYPLRSMSHDKAQVPLSALTELAAGQGGNVVIERCPLEWKKSLPVWGRPPADIALQKAVKRALDPRNIFNPGRFVTDAF